MKRKIFCCATLTAAIFLGVGGCSCKGDSAEKSAVTVHLEVSAEEKAGLEKVYEPVNVKRTVTAITAEDVEEQALFTAKMLDGRNEVRLFVLPTDANGIQTVAHSDNRERTVMKESC